MVLLNLVWLIMGVIIIVLFIASARRFSRTPSDDERIAEKALTMVVLMIFSLVPLTLGVGGIFAIISNGLEEYIDTIMLYDVDDFVEFLLEGVAALLVPIMAIVMTVVSALMNFKVPPDNPYRKNIGKIIKLMVFIAAMNSLICLAAIVAASHYHEIPSMTL